MSTSAPTVEEATEASAPVTVRLRGIGKRFPGVIANDDINIDVRRGTIHAIVGENGAGKSTLMKILYGVQPPRLGHHRDQRQAGRAALPGGRDRGRRRHGVPALHARRQLHGARERRPRRREAARHRRRRPRRDQARSPMPTGSGSSPTGWSRSSAWARASGSRSSRCSIAAPASSSSTSPPPCWCRRRSTSCSATCASSRPRASRSSSSRHKLDEVLSVADEITVIRRGTTVRTVQARGGDRPAAGRADGGLRAAVARAPRRRRSPTRCCCRSAPSDCPGWRVARCSTTSPSTSTRRGARHRRRRGQRSGRAGRGDHGDASRRHRHRRRSAASDLSGESTRERREAGIGYIPEDRHRHGLLLDAPLWENRVLGHQSRPPSAKGRLIDSAGRAPTPNGSSRSTTSARPAPTCWPGRSPAAISRSSSSAAR